MLNIWLRIMYCCILIPTTNSNTSTGTIWVTLNMPSAVEECREPSGNCQGISHCLESGHFEERMRSVELCHFQWPWMTLTRIPRSRLYLTLTISETIKVRGIVTTDLHMPYLRVLPRMTLSDLAKYWTTGSIARPLCDNWASCKSQ